jgi:hypothetical protein
MMVSRRPTSWLGGLGSWLRHWWSTRQPEVDRAAGLRQLAAVLEEAVQAQPAADDVVADCGRPGDVAGEVAKRGARLLVEFVRLSHEVSQVRVAEVDRPLALKAARQIAFHRWMLREALHLAFLANPGQRSASMRRRLAGLGPTAAGLRQLRAEVAGLLSELESTSARPGR